LDPVSFSLTDLSLEAVGRLRRGRQSRHEVAREILELRREVTVVSGETRNRKGQPLPRLPLDASQAEGLEAALSRDPLCLIQGPPGTGKTWLLAHAASVLARRGERVLVTAFTHRAVNHALRRIAEIAPDLRVVKAGRVTEDDDLRGTSVLKIPSLRKHSRHSDANTIVGATVFGVRAAWDDEPFDRLVMDEAAQIPLAAAACAMIVAGKFILVGDHRQMGPIVRAKAEDPLGRTSIFEHLAARYTPTLLRTSYRMNRGILEFPSRAFYDGQLEPARQSANRRFEAVPGGPYDDIFAPERAAILVLLDHEGFRTRSEPEARITARLVIDLMARQGVASERLAVIAPYRAQLRLIRTLVRQGLRDSGREKGPLPVIDTVERIQGQERDVVIVSLTASDPEHLAGSQAAFFFSPNRLNVTLTRARTKLVVVASEHVFAAWPHDHSGLRNAEFFRRLRRTLPNIRLTPERFTS